MSNVMQNLAAGTLQPWRKRNAPLAALDIGGGRVCCLIAAPRKDGAFDVLGLGHRVAQGLRGGAIVDFQAVQGSILAAVHEAEQTAGIVLRQVVAVTSVGCPHSQAIDLSMKLNGRPVGAHDVTRLLIAGRARAVDQEHAVLHTLPGSVAIDGRRTVREPRGLRGAELGVSGVVARSSLAPVRQLIGCIESCHLKVENVVSSAYASAYACLTREEMDFGAILIDMGADVTGIAVFGDGRLHGLDTVPLGGAHVTRDLAFGLRTSRYFAERLKAVYGSCQIRASDERQKVIVHRIGDDGDAERGEEARARLTDIIRPRLQETFAMVQSRIREMASLPALTTRSHIVLAGGASQLDGVTEFAQDTFNMSVRLGRPGFLARADGKSEDAASFAAVAGALALTVGSDGGLAYQDPGGSTLIPPRWARLSQWWKEIF